MDKLSKTEVAELERLMGLLQAKHEALESAVEAFNDAMSHEWPSVEAAQDEFNAVVDEFTTFRQDVAADIRGSIDERSEKWQDSARGQAFEAWVEPYEDEQLVDQSALECPEPLALDVEAPQDALTVLATEPAA